MEFNSYVSDVDERNLRIFEDMSSSPDQLLGNFVTSLFDWSRSWGFTTVTTVTEFAASWHSASFQCNLLFVVSNLCTFCALSGSS